MKKYTIRTGSIADYAIKAAKPLSVLVVAAAILGLYSLAAADELETQTLQAQAAAETKAAYIAQLEIAEQEAAQEEQMQETEQEEPTQEAEPQETWKSLGEFKTTGYCKCEACCGAWSDEEATTASGEKATEGVTVAADTSVLPFGSIVRINGEEYEVQDTGSAVNGNTIDIYYNEHTDALAHGVQYAEVEIKG